MSSYDLKQKTKRSLIWDLSGSAVRQIAAFAISILLARLLTPTEFGIVGIAMVFISLTDVFIDVGFTDGIIQHKQISDLMLSSIFYINFGISVILALVIIFFAPTIGSFYDSTEVTEILYYLSAIPIIAALGKVHSAILVKKMNFKALTLRTVIATIISGLIGVWAALNGKGILSLVWQQISFVIVATVALWYGSRWKPTLTFSYEEVKPLIRFSQFVFVDQLLRQFFNRINILFIGKVFSPLTLGFYSRAESLNSLVSTYTSNSLRKVIFPVLSSVQDDNERFERIFFKAIAISVGLAATIAGCLYLSSETIIIGLLGEKWRGTISLFKILVFSTIVAPPIGLISKAILSKGYAKVKFKMGLIQRILLLIPLPLGLWYGIEAFAITVIMVKYFILLIFVGFAHIQLRISAQRQLTNIILPIIPLIAVELFFKTFPIFSVHELLKTALFLIAQGIFLFLIRHEVIEVAKEVFTRLKSYFMKFRGINQEI